MRKTNCKVLLPFIEKLKNGIKISVREFFVGVIVGVIMLTLTPATEQYLSKKSK